MYGESEKNYGPISSNLKSLSICKTTYFGQFCSTTYDFKVTFKYTGVI